MEDELIPSVDRLRMDAAGLNTFLGEVFPQSDIESRGRVTEAVPGRIRMEIRPGERALRPGGIISGPAQMALADVAAYAAVLAHVGPVAMAVTNTLTIHFLRACDPGVLHADAAVLRLGRRIVTIEVRLWTKSPERLAAQATVAYTLP
jgi:uncharacterized protein (TIGR00369 family)